MTAQRSFRGAFFDGQGELRQGWRALAFFVLYPLICLPLLLFLGRFPLGATAVMALGAFLAGTLLLRLEHRPWRAVGLRFGKAWALEFLLGGLGGVLLIATAAALAWGVGGLRFGAGAPGAGRAALWGLLFFTLVAFHEELAFRGYAFQKAVAGLGAWPAQALFALLFAAVHWGNPNLGGPARAWATLNIALAALLLGLAYLRTGSLALPMGIHLGWNWAQGCLFGFAVSGTEAGGLLRPVAAEASRPVWLHGGAFGLEASLPCALVCVVAVAGLALWKGCAPREAA